MAARIFAGGHLRLIALGAVVFTLCLPLQTHAAPLENSPGMQFLSAANDVVVVVFEPLSSIEIPNLSLLAAGSVPTQEDIGFVEDLWCTITGWFGIEMCKEEIPIEIEQKPAVIPPPTPPAAPVAIPSPVVEVPTYEVPPAVNVAPPEYTTVVENTYVTNNPTTIVREYVSEDADGVSFDFLENQVNGIFESMAESVNGVRLTLDEMFADIAASFTTVILTVTGNASVGGDLTVDGTLTADSLSVASISSGGEVEAPFFTATSSTASTLPYASSTAITVSGTATIGTITVSTISVSSTLDASTTLAENFTATNATSTRFFATNASTTNATSTNLFTSNFTLGSLSGFLKATAGVIGTALVNLASDVTGVLPVANGGTGWASLASGYIPFGNGSSAIATSTNLFWDSVNSRLGIGTTSPYGKLAVMGTNDEKLGLLVGNAGQGGNPWFIGREGNATGRLAIGNGSELLSILTSGNVGIGTTTPNVKLEAWDASSISQRLTAGSSIFEFVNNGSENRISAVAALPLTFRTSNTEYMRITSAGNVGIGTTSPGARLTIDASSGAFLQIASSTNQNIFKIDANGYLLAGVGTPQAIGNGPTPKLQLFASGSAASISAVRTGSPGAGGGLGIFAASRGDGVSSFSALQTDDGLGSLLFAGDTGSSLAVTGAALGGRAEATWTPTSAPGYLFFSTTASGAINITERMRITSAGNVGIGTTSPYAKLSVDSLPDATDGVVFKSSGRPFVNIAGGTNSYKTIRFSDPGAAFRWDINVAPNNDGNPNHLGFWSQSTEALIISTGGNVGIGGNPVGDEGLWVTKASSIPIRANRSGNDGVIIALMQDSNSEGDISVSGTTVSYNAFTGSHYALVDGDVNRGELVSLSGDNQNLRGDESSEILYGATRTVEANDSQVLGAYLSVLTPSDPRSNENPDLVMAVGNGDMWVADMGEDVKRGDYLISSAVEGHAMKDVGTYPVSYVVARAAEDIVWDDVTETVEGIKHKKVSVLFESYARLNGLELILANASSTEGMASESQTFVDEFFDAIFQRLVAWFEDTENGIQEMVAGAFYAKERICVGDTCITESQLIELLNESGQASAPIEEPTEDEETEEPEESPIDETGPESEESEPAPI